MMRFAVSGLGLNCLTHLISAKIFFMTNTKFETYKPTVCLTFQNCVPYSENSVHRSR